MDEWGFRWCVQGNMYLSQGTKGFIGKTEAVLDSGIRNSINPFSLQTFFISFHPFIECGAPVSMQNPEIRLYLMRLISQMRFLELSPDMKTTWSSFFFNFRGRGSCTTISHRRAENPVALVVPRWVCWFIRVVIVNQENRNGLWSKYPTI